jgi:ATP-dependent Clp protease ATP-binding subunit ClpA
VVIMTSNLASRAILENARQGAARGESQGEAPTDHRGEQPTNAQGEQATEPQLELAKQRQRRLEQAVEQALASHFRPEFLNRIDEVIRFRPLDLGDLGRIVRLQLAELAGLLAEQQLRLEVSEPVVQMLVSQGYEPEYGARPLRRVLRRRIENPLATELLAESFKGATAVRVELGNDQDRQLRFLAIP